MAVDAIVDVLVGRGMLSCANRIILLLVLGMLSGSVPALAADGAGKSASGFVLNPNAIEQAFGDLHDSYFVAETLLRDQVAMGLEIQRRTDTLPNGNHLVSGCRMHSCDEKTGVIASPDGKILATGLINDRCAQIQKDIKRPIYCEGDPRLTVFVKVIDTRSLDHMKTLKAWADGVSHIKTVEIRTIP